MKKIIVNLILLTSMVSFASAKYTWDRMGECKLTTDDGTIIRNEKDLDKCRESEGSRYGYDRMGNCHEWTPDGALITGVLHDRYCRIKHFN